MSKNSCIRINGERGKIPKRLIGIVHQDDLLLSNLTVKETIRFAAILKSPESYPIECCCFFGCCAAPLILVPVVSPKQQKDDDESSVPSVSSGTRSSIIDVVEDDSAHIVNAKLGSSLAAMGMASSVATNLYEKKHASSSDEEAEQESN